MHHLYIDETGSAGMKNLQHPQNRFLCLTGIDIESDELYQNIEPKLAEFKETYWPGQADTVILHRTDLAQGKGLPEGMTVEEAEFSLYPDLAVAMLECTFTIMAVAIDKQRLCDWYTKPYPPYEWGLEMLTERYCMDLRASGDQGDIITEARGKKEDAAIRTAHAHLLGNGNNYHKPPTFDCLSSGKLKTVPKQKNTAGLQIADLFVKIAEEDMRSRFYGASISDHPLHNYLRIVLDQKYRRRKDGKIDGWGRMYKP